MENSSTPAMASTSTPTQTPIERFNSLFSSSEFLFIVSYRGHWCPFCRAYLTTLTSIFPSIISQGGNTVILTAEPANFLPEMRKSTGYEGEAIVDEKNELMAYLRERYGWEVAITERKGYVSGMAQPGVLVLRRKGDGEGEVEVLEKWAIVPGCDRPELAQIWDNVQAKLKGEKEVHRSYKKISAVGVLKGAFFG
ncbi:hypothetical protein ONS95_009992 [Cadophora gregata]|uniref:uncharacterized protein n=1 Tax=Cadophora gregata TaxID=51156 RepID=UPI0026DD33B0|nr:uncharacterized protein ONS95_009992 [Cadophora gregata]KAK0121707.1 hypothetical protein ONS95_009992 [Cadophora gregata]